MSNNSPTLPPNTVAAVVVTFNRLALLQECIGPLRAQSYPLARIIVVNNSSTDGTTEWLAAQPGLQVITQENRGGSFGFYTGIKTAAEGGYDWIWCMDDDGIPAADALAQLMQHAGRKPCVMNALVLDRADPENIVFKTGPYTAKADIKEPVIEGAAAFFNGSLFHKDVVQKAGLPLKDLTIWGDETEYYNRIFYREEFPVFTVTASHHYHPAQYSVFYKREWDVRSDWKIYFYIRNKAFVYASQYRSPLQAGMAYRKFLAGFLATIFIYQKKDRVAKVKLLWRAAQDGFRRDVRMDIGKVREMMAKL